ncbi:MAG: hypothetical protein HRT36_08135, partial [Alphaproteobacteria bacterium]|nr:hypothetical protein [Alphaproteobacteria bacterium]
QTFELASYGYDRVLGLELSTRLSLEKGVHAVNYVIRIADGVAYMMGLALTPDELTRVRAVTASIGGMKGMVSRIKVKAPSVKALPEQNNSEALLVDTPVAANPVPSANAIEVTKAAPIDFFEENVEVTPLPPVE